MDKINSNSILFYLKEKNNNILKVKIDNNMKSYPSNSPDVYFYCMLNYKLVNDVSNVNIDDILNHNKSISFNNRQGLVGIRNEGNTCYINSMLQCLIHCKEIADYFYSNNIENLKRFDDNTLLLKEFIRILKKVLVGNKTNISAKHIKRRIDNLVPNFRGNNQQDTVVYTIYSGIYVFFIKKY